MTAPTPELLADSVGWPRGRQRLAWRTAVQRTADDMKGAEPFGRRWNALHRDLVHAEQMVAELDDKPALPAHALSTAEALCVEAHAAFMPVAEADRLVNRGYHSTGVAWLRDHGYTGSRHPRNVRAVDTAAPVDTAEGDS